jgi:O-antigen/teichoic acid export membrane protein
MFENVRRVSSQLAVYGSADVAVLAINFLLLPVYTRVLSPEEYGVLALLLVCEAFLKVLFRWGIDVSHLRLYYDCAGEDDRRVLAGTATIVLFVVDGALLTLLAIAAGPLSDNVLGSRMHQSAFLLLLANTFLSTFLFLPFNLLRIREEAKRFATLVFCRSFATVIARLILVVGFRLGIVGIVLADVVVTSVLLAVLAPMLRATTAPRFSGGMAGKLLRLGLPRVPQGLLHQGMAISDRFFLGLYVSLAEVGVYLIGTSIASLTKLYPVAFSTAWLPFAFDTMSRPQAPRLFARLGTYAFCVLVFITLAIATLSEAVVSLMTPAAFHRASEVVPLLAVGMAIQATTTFLSTSLDVAKRTSALPVTTAIAACVTVLGHVILIPSWGIIGAAAAVAAGQLSLALSLAFVAQRRYHIPYETGRLAKIALLGIVWYVVSVSALPGTGLASLAGRVAMLALFPVGLLVLRFFGPTELSDLKQLVNQFRPKTVDRVASDGAASAVTRRLL